MIQKPSRPTGVTVLGILSILAGIVGLLAGAVLLGVSGLASVSGFPVGAGVLAAIGGITLIIGILELVYGIGFFGGKGWAWTLAIIGSVLNIIFGIVAIAIGSFGSIFGLFISVLILYYLTRQHVKAYFGKAPSMGPSMMPGQQMGSMPMGTMPSTGTGAPMGQMGSTCKNCGASIPAGAMRCPSCGASV